MSGYGSEHRGLADHIEYEAPRLVDYGDLSEVTQAIAPAGIEDGASKEQALHHTSA